MRERFWFQNRPLPVLKSNQDVAKWWVSTISPNRWDVEKLYAVVARSTFRSPNVQNSSAPERFWTLRCWKRAHRFGAKHISKPVCAKHPIVEALSEVGALKKCTPLWHEPHFQMKSAKNWRSRNTFGSWDVKKVHTVVARSTFPSEKC